jgi:predicted DNA-binding transcriptional regulator YafY
LEILCSDPVLTPFRKWHASQELKDRPDGSLVVTMQLNNLEEVSRWILGFGEHAEVKEPKELRDRLEKTAKAIQQKYLTTNS